MRSSTGARAAAPRRHSAGILLYRWREARSGGERELEVFLVHPGGPFWAKRDAGAWSIPKGECGEGEDPLLAARREFLEETGYAPAGPFVELGTVRQAGGKQVSAWATRGELDPAQLRSNRFTLEWPPRSGRLQEFPEVDRGAWCSLPQARERLLAGQLALLEALLGSPTIAE
jgi:predicted NUDIX family NTP pyrophosphohydrolase